MTGAHAAAVLAIYRAGIEEGNATFETMVGIRERIGQHHGRWRDVILIERRSQVVLPARLRRGRRRACHPDLTT